MTVGQSPAPGARPMPFWLKVALVVLVLSAIMCLIAAAFLALRKLSPEPDAGPTALPLALSTVAPVDVTPVTFVISGRETNVYVEYIMDASGSMMEQLPDGTLKRDVAKEVLSARLNSFPPEINIGLRAYGHRVDWEGQAEESCQDIELIAPVETGQLERIATWLDDFPTRGMTPLAESIRQAAEDFTIDPARVNTIVLISDGKETCEGDPCGLVEDLKLQGINFKLHVIGLHVDAETRAQLECIAQAGEGLYRDARSAKELNQALADIEQQTADDQAEITGPTATPTPTEESQPEEATPTDTPGPPTSTFTPGPPTPTFTPIPPTSTFTPLPPTHTPTPSACDDPELESPLDGQLFEADENVLLQWSYGCQLAENEHFDVQVWRSGEARRGVTWTKDPQYWLDGSAYDEDRYYWSVAVVRGRDGVVDSWVTDAAPERWVEWKGSTRTPTPELGTGDVQVTLRWHNTADLDLHVTDPSGEEIYFDDPSAASGGQLDHDANYPCEEGTSSPVENVFWPSGGAPLGRYTVQVHYFDQCSGEGTTDFTVTILVDGSSETHQGSLALDQIVTVSAFSR